MSSGSPNRLSAIRDMKFFERAISFLGSLRSGSIDMRAPGVCTPPGATAFTRIRCSRSSHASDRVIMTIAPFEVS
jgi:hypothetical protein